MNIYKGLKGNRNIIYLFDGKEHGFLSKYLRNLILFRGPRKYISRNIQTSSRTRYMLPGGFLE